MKNPWLNYYLEAQTIYRTHSPFLYDIINNCLNTQKQYYAFETLEMVRKQLIGNSDQIEVTDYGAGSKKLEKKRTISQIAKNGISTPYQCRVLFNIINHLQPKTVLEFGTSLGLSSNYMAAANSRTIIITVEAELALVEIAKYHSSKLGIKNINYFNSIFHDFIENQLASLDPIDFFYLDGHHDGQSTLNYVESLKLRLSDKSCIMVDDIHWSEDMYKAWKLLARDEYFNSSIETQYFGLLFKGDYPRHKFVYIDYWKKPWQIGLF
jgi:predicted O-methyltransferase YrrM